MTEPIEAVILSIDPAKHTSGAVILIPDYGNTLVGEDEHDFEGQYALEQYGKVETQSERERFMEAAVENAIELELPLVVVAEEWDPPRNKKLRLPGGKTGFLMDQKWTYATILGIGEGWGRWAAEVESASAYMEEEHKLPPIPVERVKPNEWRDDLFPAPRPKDSVALKVTACRYFEGVFGIRASADISEAACIGLWASTSQRVCDTVQAWAAKKSP